MTQTPNDVDFALYTPQDVVEDPQAMEIMRLWWSRSAPVMTLRPAFNDPAKFGEVLAMAARHMSRVYEMQRGMNEEDSYKQILKGLEQALGGPPIESFTERPGGGAA